MANLYKLFNLSKNTRSRYGNSLIRNFRSSTENIILGIETSCDDTGCAVVNGSGTILGEALFSQTKVHVRNGGLISSIATELHRNNIEAVVNEALKSAQKTMENIDVIAVTVKPGIYNSLEIGVKYAKYLSKIYNKPLIPIHHMEAHALVSRMFYNITFPFLCLLISGGHCLLTVVRDIDNFLLLGESIDVSPGVVFDKVARRMRLRNIAALANVPGGKAIEMAAKHSTDPNLFQFKGNLVHARDCNFSFCGLRETTDRHLRKKEFEHNIIAGIIPEINDLCAGFQSAITRHIMHRTERALIFCINNNLINSQSSTIVVSGGVACNDFLFKQIEGLGNKYNCVTYRPPHRLCTDNGVMIAWNAIEKLRKNYVFPENIMVKPNAPLGTNIIHEVKSANIPCKLTKLIELNIT